MTVLTQELQHALEQFRDAGDPDDSSRRLIERLLSGDSPTRQELDELQSAVLKDFVGQLDDDWEPSQLGKSFDRLIGLLEALKRDASES